MFPNKDEVESILPSGVPSNPFGMPVVLVGGSGPWFITTSGPLMLPRRPEKKSAMLVVTPVKIRIVELILGCCIYTHECLPTHTSSVVFGSASSRIFLHVGHKQDFSHFVKKI